MNFLDGLKLRGVSGVQSEGAPSLADPLRHTGGAARRRPAHPSSGAPLLCAGRGARLALLLGTWLARFHSACWGGARAGASGGAEGKAWKVKEVKRKLGGRNVPVFGEEDAPFSVELEAFCLDEAR